MREIRFRAWDNSYNKMIKRFICSDFRLAINSDGKVLGYNEESDTNECDIYKNRFIIMQFTGFKDKNGNEIYDGDIIKYDFHSTSYPDREIIIKKISEVKWNNDKASYMVVNNFLYDGYLFEYVNDKNSIEIIGNIHQHSNLLELP